MNDQMPQKPDNQQGPKGPPPVPPNRLGRSLMGWLIIAGLILLVMSFFRGDFNRQELTADEFWDNAAKPGQFTGTLVIREKEILGEFSEKAAGLKEDEPRKFKVVYNTTTEQDFAKRLDVARTASGDSWKYKFETTGWWQSLLPQLLVMMAIFFVVWFFLFRRIGAASGGGFLGNFGRSRHRLTTKEQSKITFRDVAGVEEAKDEVQEIIQFLKNPRRFQRLGGRIPRGVLLVGEPGCGKTLLAKAIAGEADVPFFSISGSDFVEMFVGVGASRVRDLFKQAKASAPCIIFLDEIDAVGRRRGVGFNGGGHDEREQTLNAILVEMDGFDSSDQVIVIAATNRMDVLDPALTRPGRFDRQINVPLPDIKGRYEILKIYADKVKCGPDVDLHRMARGTPMFSGADLAALVNEAAIAATMANKDCIEQVDMEEARDKVRWGRARKSRVIDDREKEMTSYHEAGHAIVQVLTPEADPLHKVSILPRASMGGATFSLPEKDRYMYTRKWCEAFIRVAMAGRIAEEMFFGDIDSGASSDIAQATELARKMVTEWGMSDKLSFVRYAPSLYKMNIPDFGTKDYSEKTAELIDEEVKSIMDKAWRETTELLKANRDGVKKIAEALLKYETLSAEEVKQILDGGTLDKPTVDDLLKREHAKTQPAVGVQPPPAEPQADHGVLPEPN